ncbi:MAG: glycoside hydrolase family 65 protein [Acetatifactor sp.]|nr:glycoside hydrolase family 65 protein [Acetatifactor sp.]
MGKLKTADFSEEWTLSEEGFNRSLSKHYEGLFTQGNGYMDLRGSVEEGFMSVDQALEYDRKPANVTLEKHIETPSKWGTYIPGIVGKHPYLETEIINLPYICEVSLCADGEKFDLENSSYEDYRRYLDMRDGCLHRSFVWNTKSGKKVSVTLVRFLSMSNTHILTEEIVLRSLNGEADITVSSGINAGVRTNGFDHFETVKCGAFAEKYTECTVSTNGGNTVTFLGSIAGDHTCFDIEKNDHAVYHVADVKLCEGAQVSLVKTVAAATDRDQDMESDDIRANCLKYLERSLKDGIEKEYAEHLAVWQKKWDDSDIILTGSDTAKKAMKALRMSIYHLNRSVCGNDPRVAICAKGYAGEGYFGRYFWDTEINMLPFFIHTDPKAAKNLLLFRYNTLSGARENAASYGYRGARYPWESSVTGREECACWQYADHEIHVTADIVYAIMHYVNATGDEDFVRDYGIDIMVETARYWMDRMDKDLDGTYNLLGVMGPDEYLAMTANNAYTNRMVRFALDTTVRYMRKYLADKNVTDRLNFTEAEVAEFENAAENLKRPVKNKDGITLQCDEFESYADLDFDVIWKDRSKCFGTFISQEKNYRSKALKQADVLEMMMLFGNEVSDEELEKNYAYYEPITTHDSSLSAAVHGILSARLGRMDEAEKFLEKVEDIDLKVEKKGAEEGIHIANCGGIWQLFVYGFAGMKSAMWEEEPVTAPHLPEGIDSITFPVIWHGEKKKITVSK